jgi:signal transduction histidine kinase
MATIFDLFVQEEHAVRFNNRGRGLGIGLALVKNLVEAHNGTISACSAGSGLGSQFTVIFAKLPDVP